MEGKRRRETSLLSSVAGDRGRQTILSMEVPKAAFTAYLAD